MPITTSYVIRSEITVRLGGPEGPLAQYVSAELWLFDTLDNQTYNGTITGDSTGGARFNVTRPNGNDRRYSLRIRKLGYGDFWLSHAFLEGYHGTTTQGENESQLLNGVCTVVLTEEMVAGGGKP